MLPTNSHQPGQTAWNPYQTVPSGKHRVVNGRSVWLASSKATYLPFKSGYSFGPATISKLKRILSKFWPSHPPLLPPTLGQARLDFTLPGAATIRFILLCSLWYTTSALSSNTGKAILTQFRHPVTLTFIQFGFVALYCLLFMSPIVRFSRLRKPTKAIINNTLPMGMFQVGGHMFSSMAISRIPVSTVHTIKALSPLFTVAAYALLFGVSYSPKTYISLLPLTLGVMLACTFDVSASNTTGLLCAFGSALVFVSSNIFFKKIMPSPSKSSANQQSANKLDKLNLLFYSSGLAFLLMIPLWLYYDVPILLSSPTYIAHPPQGHSTPHSVSYYFIMNGTVHFAQNIIAFVILSTTSPVTYSIASLIKRVAVICIAIVWFSQSVHPMQGIGIMMTFFGLWMYNNAKGDVEKGENKMRRVEAARDMMLPSTKAEDMMMSGIEPSIVAAESAESTTTGLRVATAYGRPRGMSVLPQQLPIQRTHPLPLPLPLPASQSHTNTQPSFHIKVVPPPGPTSISIPKILPSFGSYPSPPPSLDDSPPSNITSLPHPYSIPGSEARVLETRVSA